MIFVSFAVAKWLGMYYENPYYGYMIVALFYVVVQFALIIFRKPLARYVKHKIQIRMQPPIE